VELQVELRVVQVELRVVQVELRVELQVELKAKPRVRELPNLPNLFARIKLAVKQANLEIHKVEMDSFNSCLLA
jgi:hypothetical protein